MSERSSTSSTLRSRKPKMVPYLSTTTVPDFDLSSPVKQPENAGQTKGDSDFSTNGRVQAIPQWDDSGGGGTQTDVPDIIEHTETTIDTQPLLEDSDSGDEFSRREVVLKDSSESSLAICLQVTLPYIIAGFGMVLAGMVLDIVQHWPVFVEVSEIFVLVPALLGLKGNLEMTLASRLSTQANLGNMNKSAEKWSMVGGNMALIQAQAIVVGFLASVAAMIFGWIPDGKFNIEHALLLCASSMCTAALASFVLGCIMVGVVMLSKKCNVNPDNVATPIAASLGDLTTLALLSGIACLLYKAIGTQHWLAPVMIVTFILLCPLWIYISLHNQYTKVAVYSGWTPVLCAMVISSVGGLILDFTVSRYDGIAVFQPVINGVGGNLVAVHASRISTSLHQVTQPGKMPVNAVKGCPNCPSAFFGKHVTARAARVLLLLVIPGHLIFMYTIATLNAGHTTVTFIFAVMYLAAALLQVAILLYIANWMVHFIWKIGDDPDNVAIPYLTALGDLLGTAFLALAFHVLYLIGDRDEDVDKFKTLTFQNVEFARH